ncbi:aldo/keto reductase [Kocuria sp.]|uniref:aldo/keto reductase n=1 Tax=Kocuria sp. TaxID=1871328 RepID=UPI0026DC3D9B|nr:aldo/keto reductase [Kocuria sp.]MDO4919421.1 aldo/keto reductase [Kocuria sp.]
MSTNHDDAALPVPIPGGPGRLAGHTVARVGYGAMQLPRLADADAACAVLRRALELGVNHFDTAYFYGDGMSNECLAREVVDRPGVVVVTKVGARPARRGPAPLVSAQRPEELRQGVLDNLRTLHREQLDVVNMRRIGAFGFPKGPDQFVDFDDQVAEMVAMRDEGLIGAIGLSTVTADELARALPAGIACVQNPYGVASRKDEPVLAVCRAEGIPWVPYFPLGGAFPGAPKVVKEPVVQEIAAAADTTPAAVGLAWLLHHAPDTLLIPGTASVAHLEQNVAAGSLELDEDALRRLDELTPTTGASGALNRFRRG